MKNLPKKIYLQVDPEKEYPEDFNDLSEVTWCIDRICDTDIEYVLKKNDHKKGEPELTKILRIVCEVNEVEIVAVKGRRRFKNLITAKREYGYLARKLTKKSLAEIGKKINRDHANVLYHNRIIKGWLEIKGYYLHKKFEMIEERLKI